MDKFDYSGTDWEAIERLKNGTQAISMTAWKHWGFGDVWKGSLCSALWRLVMWFAALL